MPWFQVDDAFSDHPKVKRISRRERAGAIGLWLLAGTWCAKHLTDGDVPSYMPDDFGATAKDAAALVKVGLWHSAGHSCPTCPQPTDDGGWVFHDWSSWQPTREQVEKKRAEARERMAKRRSGSRDVRANTDGTPGEVRDEFVNPSPTQPYPALVPTEQENPSLVVVCRLTNPNGSPDDDEKLIAGWRRKYPDVAPKLEGEADAFLEFNRSNQPDNWSAAWVGWLRRKQSEAVASITVVGECSIHPGHIATNCGGCRADKLAGEGQAAS